MIVSNDQSRVDGLDKSEKRFQALFENTPDVILVADIDGNIVQCNSKIETLLGYSGAEVLGKKVEILIPKRFREQHIVSRENYSKNPVIREMGNLDLLALNKDGSEIPVAIGLGFFKEEEKTYFLATIRDISAYKRAQEDLINLNRELESFSYSVSHDLRSPLRAINGFTDLLQTDYSAELSEDAKGLLNRIYNAGKKMGLLIDGLLDLSRLGRTELFFVNVDISKIVSEVVNDIKETSPERKAEFVICPGENVKGDPRLLSVVLNNLLWNAWKFSSKKEKTMIEFGVKTDEGIKTYFIRDNGCGFEMKHVDKLFGTFQRLHSQDEFQGIGIGLATVKRIILRHSGRIWAESELEKGATFYFQLQGC
jgi:PAS domain S-box-containing protein